MNEDFYLLFFSTQNFSPYQVPGLGRGIGDKSTQIWYKSPSSWRHPCESAGPLWCGMWFLWAEPSQPLFSCSGLVWGIQGPPRSLLPTILRTAKTGIPRSSIPELKAFQNAQLILGLPPSEYTSTPSFFPTGPSSKKGMRWTCLSGERLQGRGAPPAPSGWELPSTNPPPPQPAGPTGNPRQAPVLVRTSLAALGKRFWLTDPPHSRSWQFCKKRRKKKEEEVEERKKKKKKEGEKIHELKELRGVAAIIWNTPKFCLLASASLHFGIPTRLTPSQALRSFSHTLSSLLQCSFVAIQFVLSATVEAI